MFLDAALEQRARLVPVDRDAQRFQLALVAGRENFFADRRDLSRQRGEIARGRRGDVGVRGALGHAGLLGAMVRAIARA